MKMASLCSIRSFISDQTVSSTGLCQCFVVNVGVVISRSCRIFIFSYSFTYIANNFTVDPLFRFSIHA